MEHCDLMQRWRGMWRRPRDDLGRGCGLDHKRLSTVQPSISDKHVVCIKFKRKKSFNFFLKIFFNFQPSYKRQRAPHANWIIGLKEAKPVLVDWSSSARREQIAFASRPSCLFFFDALECSCSSDIHSMFLGCSLNVHWMLLDIHWMLLDIHWMLLDIHSMLLDIHSMFIGCSSNASFASQLLPRRLASATV